MPEIIPIWLSVLTATLIPTVVILLLTASVPRLRSFSTLSAALLGLYWTIILGAVIQAILKWFIGGLRPHFYAVCRPRLATTIESQIAASVAPSGLIFHDRAICTNPNAREVDDALSSFPSGHSVAAFGAFGFLALYLNAQLKVWGDGKPRFWKLVLLWVPMVGAAMIAGAMVVDGSHHWYDVVGGAVLGLGMAGTVYRTMFRSLWDYETNHEVL
jgi:diacylglycerol diphosphate phosphatase / phosphatidate phosphatase